MMPHGFEYVVRPFQQPGSLGNVIIPGTPQRTQEQAHITWGAVGTLPEVKLVNPDVNLNLKKEDLTERDRDSDTVRIPINQTSDNSGYVEIARARKVRLNKEETSNAGWLNNNIYAADSPQEILDHEKLAPYLKNFSMQTTNTSSSGPTAVTWNMKNQ